MEQKIKIKKVGIDLLPDGPDRRLELLPDGPDRRLDLLTDGPDRRLELLTDGPIDLSDGAVGERKEVLTLVRANPRKCGQKCLML